MRFLVPQSDAEWAWRRDVLERAVVDPAARAQVNSGKLAEPYWYLDSPLTTGRPREDFPTTAGQPRPPVAGVLCPDARVNVPREPSVTRLRELFGTGLTVLGHTITPTVDTEALTRAYRLDLIDRDGLAAEALHAAPGWCAVVRSDGHLAAVLHDPDADTLRAALNRARGCSS